MKPEAPPPKKSETRAAQACRKSPAAGGPSMEAIVERSNLRKALEQVQGNKGAPGVDDMRAATSRSRCGASRYRKRRAAHARSAFRRCSTASSSRR